MHRARTSAAKPSQTASLQRREAAAHAACAVRTHINCGALFAETAIDAPRETEGAPHLVPARWMPAFTMDGRYPFYDGGRGRGVLNNKYLGASALVSNWTRASVDALVALASKRSLHGSYGVHEVNTLADALSVAGISGASVRHECHTLAAARAHFGSTHATPHRTALPTRLALSSLGCARRSW